MSGRDTVELRACGPLQVGVKDHVGISEHAQVSSLGVVGGFLCTAGIGATHAAPRLDRAAHRDRMRWMCGVSSGQLEEKLTEELSPLQESTLDSSSSFGCFHFRRGLAQEPYSRHASVAFRCVSFHGHTASALPPLQSNMAAETTKKRETTCKTPALDKRVQRQKEQHVHHSSLHPAGLQGVASLGQKVRGSEVVSWSDT